MPRATISANNIAGGDDRIFTDALAELWARLCGRDCVHQRRDRRVHTDGGPNPRLVAGGPSTITVRSASSGVSPRVIVISA
jgi:hypothetical protein